MSRTYTHLWLDVVAGLKKEGWETVGENYNSFIILKKAGREIKVFIRDFRKLDPESINSIVVRYS